MTDLPPAVILAGGAARRMGGGDKALLPLGGARVIDHLLARLRGQVGALALNANGDPGRWAGLDLPVLPDPLPGQPGPLAGLLAAMDWAAGLGSARVVTVPGDTPFLPRDLVARLAAADGAAIARDAAGRDHPVCGIWPVTAAALLRDLLARDQRRVMGFCAAVAARPVSFADSPPPPFFNINTPQDLARAETWLRPAP